MLTMSFASSLEFRTWLAKHHSESDGLWVRIYKKDSSVASVTYIQTQIGFPLAPSPRWPIVWSDGWPSRVAEYSNKIASTRFCCALDGHPPDPDVPPSG